MSLTDLSFHDVAQTVGWFGTAMLLTAYWLVSNRRVTGEGWAYQGLNIGGSLGLGIAALDGAVWSSVALNGVWMLIGLQVLLARQRREARRSAGEAAPD
jgi:hypothetical protein